MASAHLGINTSKIRQNIMQLKRELTPNSNLLLIAKANAYGLGAIPICKTLSDCIDYIGVATIAEAIELRNEQIKTPILLLSEPHHNDFNIISNFNISVTVYNKETIDNLNNYALTTNKTIKTHLKIDTGMTRLGSNWDESDDVLSYWHNTSTNIIKEGVYSHFANSDNKNHPLNSLQLSRFNNLEAEFKSPLIHFSNSDAINHFKSKTFNISRVGLAAYIDSFTLTAPIRCIKQISAGTSVGYGSTFTASEPTQIGIIGIGYADGIATALSNKGYVVINNQECPIIGQICMDMFMVKLPSHLNVTSNHNAIIISPEGAPGLSITELAKITSQNPREIMTHFSNRIQRDYNN